MCIWQHILLKYIVLASDPFLLMLLYQSPSGALCKVDNQSNTKSNPPKWIHTLLNSKGRSAWQVINSECYVIKSLPNLISDKEIQSQVFTYENYINQASNVCGWKQL